MLAVAVVFALSVPRLKITTNITDFLPDNANRRAQIAALLAQSDVARIMIVDLEGPDARARALSLVDDLRTRPEVASARSGVTEADVTATMEFLSAWPPTTFVPRAAYTDEALRARLGELRDQLGSPVGVIARQYAPRDPLGGMWEPFEAMRAARGTAVIASRGFAAARSTPAGSAELSDDDGVLMSADRTHAFVFVETRASPFDTGAQRRFRARLDDWLKTSPSTRMTTAGAAQFAIASEAQIKHDVSRIATISTLGILAIFLLLFGSLRLIGVGFVPMLFGSAVAMLATQAIFGEVHGITIAFGTSLLGVGLDYVEHYYAHFVLTPNVTPTTTMKEVGPSIVFGALTTIIGFIGIGASGLPGLRQMAAFSVIAIIASMTATYFIVPPWMPLRYRPPRTLERVNGSVLALLVRITQVRWTRNRRIAVAAVLAIGALAGLYHARFSDNVNMLVEQTGAHVAADRAVRSRLGPEANTYAVVTAESDDALLAALDAATGELERARTANVITSYVPVGRLVPSRDEQLARHAAAREAAPRIRSAMAELDFVPEQFQPFWDALAQPPKPITLRDLRKSPLAPVVAAWLPTAAKPIAIIPLYGVRDAAALRARVKSATIVVPQDTIVELFRGVRVQTIVASGLGLLAIFMILFVRYRSARKSVVALIPGVLACAATVATLVIAGVPLTILHVMALLLVVSMGVDFGIFFIDTVETQEQSARTMVSILTASITTILSFGLLSLSSSPGLAALGLTVTLGVTFGSIFCLVIASWTGHRASP